MARGRRRTTQSERRATAAESAATTGHEAELWRMADALRGSMDASEYKNVVLGLIFLEYISDAFEEMHTRLEGEQALAANLEALGFGLRDNVEQRPEMLRHAHGS